MSKYRILQIVTFLILCCVHVLNCEDVTTTENPRVTVTTAQGDLTGLERETKVGIKFYSFKGIPYAEPPIDDLRFKDPVPVKSWSGVRDATKDGSFCPQINVVMGDFIGEEDCLYLNVYTPSIPRDGETKKYPVLVNIHSGGFTMGSGAESEFNPQGFMENDIIVVSINYRLGIFGFLSLDIPEVPGNAALKDQRLALIWVKNNIHNFNGDPKNVTLMGISAGSTSVEYQMLHPESKDLFQKASMQSGSALSSWSRARSQEVARQKLVDHLGISNDPKEILDHLKSLSTLEVLNAADKTNDKEMHRLGYIFTQFTPVVEKSFPNVDSFITMDPLEIYKRGDFVKVPTLRSFCRDEGTVFQFMYGDLTDEISHRKYADFMSFLNVANKAEIDQKLTDLYSSMNVTKIDETHEFLSDLMFLSGVHQTLKYVTKNAETNHYTYMFSYVGNAAKDEFEEVLGKVPHTIDMSYLVFLDGKSMSPQDLKMRKYLADIFINFINKGDPTTDDTEHWKPSSKDNKYNVLNIQNSNKNEVIAFPFEDRMKFWDTLF